MRSNRVKSCILKMLDVYVWEPQLNLFRLAEIFWSLAVATVHFVCGNLIPELA